MAGNQEARRLQLPAANARTVEIFLQVFQQLVPGLGKARVVGAGAHIEVAGPLHIVPRPPDHHCRQPDRAAIRSGDLLPGEDIGRRAARFFRREMVVIGLHAGEAQIRKGLLHAGVPAAQVGRAAQGHGGYRQLVKVGLAVPGKPGVVPGEGHFRRSGDAGADLGGGRFLSPRRQSRRGQQGGCCGAQKQGGKKAAEPRVMVFIDACQKISSFLP